MGCGCNDCEAMMQPYLDGMLSDAEVKEAHEHLERCPGCDKRFRFEERLRHFVRVAVDEPMPAGLRDKLAGLRSTPPAG
jgi:anti-sigma factor (TIGR02949 family)